MEFDDLMKKRIMELEEFFKKIIENSDKFSEIREFLSANGYNAILCMMTLIYKPEEEDGEFLEEDYFEDDEDEIDEELEEEFRRVVCEYDKSFLKEIQNNLDY